MNPEPMNSDPTNSWSANPQQMNMQPMNPEQRQTILSLLGRIRGCLIGQFSAQIVCAVTVLVYVLFVRGLILALILLLAAITSLVLYFMRLGPQKRLSQLGCKLPFAGKWWYWGGVFKMIKDVDKAVSQYSQERVPVEVGVDDNAMN